MTWIRSLLALALLGVAVFSYPVAEELISDENDGDYQYDEVESKPEETVKRGDIAGSGAEPGKKDEVKPVTADTSKVVDNPESDESESPASGEEEDEAPKEKADDADADAGSGSGSEPAETTTTDKKKAAIIPQEEEQPSSEEETAAAETASDEKAAEEPSTTNFESEQDADTETAKKAEVTSVNQEFEDEDGDKRDKVASVEPAQKRDYGHHDDCHHCHGHEGGCHEGCCCEHEGGHHHGHHEHEDCCHHHGHHHGFVHEWGTECCGGHHEHECCGAHEHGHHHDHDHEHECCHHNHDDDEHCCHHEPCHSCHHEGGDGGGGHGGGDGGGGGGYGGGGYGGGGGGGGARGGYGWGRSNVPVGYHCHDMVSKDGQAKTKRFCVPVYGFPEYDRDTISRPIKKQTVHVGYGYASGDNYRLGYQQGGMGGLASSFTGQLEAQPHDSIGDRFSKRSYFARPVMKRHYNGQFASYNHGMLHGSATPYGHPVTHPGFTTMGYPGHALASQDVRSSIPRVLYKYKRDAFEDEPEEVQPESAPWGDI